jgi:hypothetical protein
VVGAAALEDAAGRGARTRGLGERHSEYDEGAAEDEPERDGLIERESAEKDR